jgi:hypothetical protein
VSNYLDQQIGEHGYARQRDARRNFLRKQGGPVGERIEANEALVPAPDAEWAEPAKAFWTMARSDEAEQFWSSGDYMRLWIACQYYSDMLAGRTRYSAQAMEVIMSTMTELRLSDRAKRADGIIVVRTEEPDVDPEAAGWVEEQLAGLAEGETGATEDNA